MLQCLGKLGAHLFQRGIDSLLADAETLQLHAVEALGILAHCLVATGTHVLDDIGCGLQGLGIEGTGALEVAFIEALSLLQFYSTHVTAPLLGLAAQPQAR